MNFAIKSSSYKTNLAFGRFRFLRTKEKEKPNTILTKTPTSDVFIKTAQITPEQVLANLIISRGKITKSQFQKIKSESPEIIELARKYIKQNAGQCAANPEEIAKLSVNIAQKLQENYGKNFNLISLGTSPSIIGEGLRYLGIDVNFVPVTNLRYINSHNTTSLLDELAEREPMIDVFNQLIEKYANNGKRTVIMDYVYTGMTKSKLLDLIKKNPNLKNCKIEFFPLMSAIVYSDKELKIPMSEKELYDIDKSMFSADIVNLSNVPHFYIDDNGMNKNRKSCVEYQGSLEDLIAQIEQFSKPSAKAFSLCMFDEIDKLTAQIKKSD